MSRPFTIAKILTATIIPAAQVTCKSVGVVDATAEGAGRSILRPPMLTKLLKAKIHRCTCTFTDVNYPGSITIDPVLMGAAGLLVNEAVLVADCETGNRFETYVIAGEPGDGVIGVNGAAARLTGVGNKLIVLSFVLAAPEELAGHSSRVVLVDDRNCQTELLTHRSTGG